MGIGSAYSAASSAMNERMTLIGWFALGVGLEVFLLIGRDLNGLKMLGAVAAGLFVTFFSRRALATLNSAEGCRREGCGPIRGESSSVQ